MERIAQRATAEFIGTFALIFIGAGSVVLAQNVAGTLGVALAHGLVLAIMVSILAHISGAHFNPAITIGAWSRTRSRPRPRACTSSASSPAGPPEPRFFG